jgi:hypothetical protein
MMHRNFRDRIPHWMLFPPLFLVSALIVVAALYFLAAGVAHAAPPVVDQVSDVPPTSHTLIFSSVQFWALAIGTVVPLITYVLNTHAPWITEPVKAVVQVVMAALAGAIYQLATAGSLSLDSQTLQVLLSSVVAALAAHKLLWQPSGISTTLGAGTNLNLATKKRR